MDPLAALALGLGLSADAVAVAIACAVRSPHVPLAGGLLMAAVFACFQGLMPCIGYAAGAALGPWFTAIDHWVAFTLLAAIGGKMAWEGWRGADSPEPAPWPAPLALLTLAFATSVDALAAGVGMVAVTDAVLVPVLIIAATTGVLCLPAVFLGRRLGIVFGRRAEIVGGLLLIGLGTKILIDHLSAAAPMLPAGT